MAVWDVTSALSSLRSLLGDGPSDKFEFKADVYPTPDTVTTRFFVGQTRLVDGTLKVYLNGQELAPSGVVDINTMRGEFALPTAPSGTLQASFYYQWFTDAELMEFLTDAASLLNRSGISDDFEVGLRPALLQFACYNAYMRKAAEFAEAVETSAGGYTFRRNQATPNWKDLARVSMENAKAKLDLYLQNPVEATRIAVAFVSYGINRYVGP